MRHKDPNTIVRDFRGEFEALERVRTEVIATRRRGHFTMAFSLAGLAAFALALFAGSENGLFIFLAVPVAVIMAKIIHHHYFGKGKARYHRMFKYELIRPLVASLEPGLNFEPDDGIAEALFNTAGLHGSRADRYHSEDLFHGKTGKTKIMFSEVHAEERHTSTDSKGNTTTSWTTIFKGIFFIADFNKEFRSSVSVLPDFAESTFGWFGKQLQKMSGGLQTMESPEFEALFVVRGTDPVETRYLLTPRMQECLIELRQRVGDDMRVGFRDSKVIIAMPKVGDWFEPDLNLPADDHGQITGLLRQLWNCLRIVEDLDLNTRIWTKD